MATSGTPGIDAPGTRGKENTSFSPPKWGSSAQGSVLPSLEATLGAPATDDGAVAESDPLGGALGGEEGTATTPGKEYISAAGGICGALAHGPPFCASTDAAEVPGSSGEAAAEGGTRAVAPDSDAAIARKSASLRAPTGCEIPETMPAVGAAGEENTSRGKSGVAGGTAGIPPASDEASIPAACAGTTAPGSAAKNSFASFAITAGSGTADIKAETP
ncbi:MAG: hypothetical protein WAK29_21300 [Terriglobales bacterium]